MDFYNIPLRSGDLATVISDCYQVLGRRATIDLLDDMNQLGFRESTRSGLSLRHRRPGHARHQDARSSATPKRPCCKYQEALRARHHHRGRALQPGARRLDARPRTDHRRNDGRDGNRRPRRPRLRQPGLPDGPLRCPRRRRTDPPAGRHARSDGQAVRQDHRDADQGQLPRRPDRAGVLQLHARCPQRVWPTRP